MELFHYQLLGRANAELEHAQNNLGVAFNQCNVPIHATEEFKAASRKGHALATSNIVHQFLRAGFVAEADAWAEAHKANSDKEGYVSRALATAHSLRAAENERINELIASEFQHRSALASFASSLVSDLQSRVDGEWLFPLASLHFTSDGGEIVGKGESNRLSGGKILHSLKAINRSGLWRFEIRSRRESDNNWSSNEGSSNGLFTVSDDGRSLSVLEYHSSSSIAVYSVSKVKPQEPPQP